MKISDDNVLDNINNMNKEELKKTCKMGVYDPKKCKYNQTREYFCHVPPNRCYMAGSYKNFVIYDKENREKYKKFIKEFKKKGKIKPAKEKEDRWTEKLSPSSNN